jgi:alpha-mannosidase
LELPFTDAKATYEIPYGSVEREPRAGHEAPALRWVSIDGRLASGGSATITLVSDSKHGFGFDGKTLRASLIRSSYDPDPLPEIGDHEMRFRLFPGCEPRSAAALARLATQFDQPIVAVPTNVHTGALGAARAGLELKAPESVVVTQLKIADAGSATLVRLVNYGAASPVELAFDAQFFGELRDATAADLLERPLREPAVSVTKQRVSLTIADHAVTSVLVDFG